MNIEELKQTEEFLDKRSDSVDYRRKEPSIVRQEPLIAREEPLILQKALLIQTEEPWMVWAAGMPEDPSNNIRFQNKKAESFALLAFFVGGSGDSWTAFYAKFQTLIDI